MKKKTLCREIITEGKHIERLLQEKKNIKYFIYSTLHQGFPLIIFLLWRVKQLVAHSVSLVRISFVDEWGSGGGGGGASLDLPASLHATALCSAL